jgi:hypothetical protein
MDGSEKMFVWLGAILAIAITSWGIIALLENTQMAKAGLEQRMDSPTGRLLWVKPRTQQAEHD